MFLLITIGLIWGITNVLMKKGSQGITEISSGTNVLTDFFYETLFLLSRPIYILSFLGNMFGSTLFYYALSKNDVSLVGPIVNSLTFIFTTTAGKIINNESINLSINNYLINH